MCDEFYQYRSITFHVICSDTHENKNCVFASVFIGTRKRKHLQQPEPQYSVSLPLPDTVPYRAQWYFVSCGRMAIDHPQRWALTHFWTSLTRSASFPCQQFKRVFNEFSVSITRCQFVDQFVATLVIVLLLAIPSSDRRSNVQQQKPRNQTVYFYLTLWTYFLVTCTQIYRLLSHMFTNILWRFWCCNLLRSREVHHWSRRRN